MNNEIKEIIELINTKYKDYYIDDFLSGEDVKKLVDYITNLQTIEQQYGAILSENAELENKATNLQEEYEKEHYLVDKLTRQLNDEYKNTEYQCKQKEIYKSRNEKAIQKINDLIEVEKKETAYDRFFSDSDYEIKKLKDIKNTLQGEDKDE